VLLGFLTGLLWILIWSKFMPLLGQPEIPSEMRGVWLTNIDSEVLFTPTNTQTAIAALSQHHFNTLYPTVWNGGHTLYPSEVAQKNGIEPDPTITKNNPDWLQKMLTQGHKQGMTIIPWFEFGFMAPAESAIAQHHPTWLTQTQNGETLWLEGKKHPRVWLNPLHPEVQQLISDLILDLAARYPIDGIQFDDHFGYPAEFGYDPFTLALYQEEHNGQLPPNPIALNPNENCVTTDPQWQAWVDWRSQKISAYFKTLFQQIKAQNPNLLISVSPNPQTFSKNCFLSDWYSWERQGLIEELVLQVYRSKMADFIKELNQPEVQKAKSHIPVIVGILSGLKGRPTPMPLIQEQVQWVRSQDFAGVSFFFYESLWNLGLETPPERQTQFRAIFSETSQRPKRINPPSDQ
jgi:uncharacterized lipoprotein YddW (UPF0748 family)